MSFVKLVPTVRPSRTDGKQVLDAELLSNRRGIVAASFELERRGHLRHLQIWDTPQRADELERDAGGEILLVLIGVLASLWLVKELATNNGGDYGNAGFALILGGAIGNTWDRVRRGAVTDFLDFHWYDSHWPAFNLADVALNLGVLLLLVELLRRRRLPAHT